MTKAITVEDIMERWSLKTRKTAIALMTENPELHAYQIHGTWYVEEKYLQKFIDNLCKTGGTSRKPAADCSLIFDFEDNWALRHLQKIGLTKEEIDHIIKMEKERM